MTYDFACDRSEYDAFLARMRQVVEPATRLPDWPFRSTQGLVDLCDYNELSDDDFAGALEVLARAHGDESVSLVVLDPGTGRSQRSTPRTRRAPGATTQISSCPPRMWSRGSSNPNRVVRGGHASSSTPSSRG